MTSAVASGQNVLILGYAGLIDDDSVVACQSRPLCQFHARPDADTYDHEICFEALVVLADDGAY